MAELVVQLEEDVLEKLHRHADDHGRSIEEEVREILVDAVKSKDCEPVGLGTRLAAIFHGVGIDEEIGELRGYPLTPIEFDP